MSVFIGNLGVAELERMVEQWKAIGPNHPQFGQAPKAIADLQKQITARRKMQRCSLPKKKQRELGLLAPVGWRATYDSDAVLLYVVYENPSDYPGKFLVRRFVNTKPDLEPLAVADTMEEARRVIPDNCMNIGRFDQDDKAIKEVYVL